MPAGVTLALVELSRTFASLGARWYVFGAQAVVAAGVPRLTADIDVTVELPPSRLPALLAALERHGFTARDVGDVDAFVAETRVLPVEHRSTNLPVDVILAGPGLEEEMLARVQLRTVEGVDVPFLSTPDLIALKLLAARQKDLEDVRALVRAAPPDLSLDVARARVAALAELLDDPNLLPLFERTVSARGTRKQRKPRGKR